MFRFRKNERLTSKKIFDQIFSQGKIIQEYPFKALYIKKNSQLTSHIQVGIAVSKKNLKKATLRNTIKRRFREAFRLNKKKLVDFLIENDIYMAIVFVYVAKTAVAYADIEKKIIVILDRLIEHLNEDNNKNTHISDKALPGNL